MIKDLLARLKEQAASEAEHKAFCDEELRQNKLKREEKQSEVDTLTAQIAEKGTVIANQAKEIKELAEQHAELTKALAEATAVRAKEKEENLAAIKDAQEAQTAVKQAITILKEIKELAEQQAGL